MTEINWKRDLDGNVPVKVEGQLDALSMEHSDVRRQLAILRKTRGQRDVGTLKVPAHLRVDMGVDLNDAGVRRVNGPAE